MTRRRRAPGRGAPSLVVVPGDGTTPHRGSCRASDVVASVQTLTTGSVVRVTRCLDCGGAAMETVPGDQGPDLGPAA